MNTLVFVTYSIEPEHWSAFARAAAVPPLPGDSVQAPLIPYILVSSASASAKYYTSTQPTERLTQAVETELVGFTHTDLQRLFKALVDWDENNTVDTAFFVVLDAESAQDSKAVVVERSLEWVDEEGQPTELTPDDGAKERTVWRWHRVPFEKVWDNLALLSAKGRMMQEEEFLEEEIRED